MKIRKDFDPGDGDPTRYGYPYLRFPGFCGILTVWKKTRAK
jgi:hypothetical protein